MSKPCAPPRFDGPGVEAQDVPRLAGQLERVRALMADGKWRTLKAIAEAVGGSEAGVSARLRDQRKKRFGGLRVERERVEGGLYRYRVLPPLPEVEPVQAELPLEEVGHE